MPLFDDKASILLAAATLAARSTTNGNDPEEAVSRLGATLREMAKIGLIDPSLAPPEPPSRRQN